MSTALDLRSRIEHTLLRAEATEVDIDRLCDEAAQHGLLAVCINPLFVARARARLQNTPVLVVTVIGFPLGAGLPRVLAQEARSAIEEGAHEIDMVIPLGAARSADFATVARHVQAVRDAAPGAVLKVILETGHFTAQQLEPVALAALRPGPQFLKTSTGFGPRGASIEDVRQLSALCPAGVGVKASGGIRTRDEALAMVAAGAARLGTSSGVAIVTAA